jgi:hypothetical protein
LEKEELERELGKARNKVRIRKIKKSPMKQYIFVIRLSRMSREDLVVWPRFEPGTFHNRSLQYSAMTTCSVQSILIQNTSRLLNKHTDEGDWRKEMRRRRSSRRRRRRRRRIRRKENKSFTMLPQ